MENEIAWIRVILGGKTHGNAIALTPGYAVVIYPKNAVTLQYATW
jgi:hypothetical protein